jgi:hypothetical protein
MGIAGIKRQRPRTLPRCSSVLVVRRTSLRLPPQPDRPAVFTDRAASTALPVKRAPDPRSQDAVRPPLPSVRPADRHALIIVQLFQARFDRFGTNRLFLVSFAKSGFSGGKKVQRALRRLNLVWKKVDIRSIMLPICNEIGSRSILEEVLIFQL